MLDPKLENIHFGEIVVFMSTPRMFPRIQKKLLTDTYRNFTIRYEVSLELSCMAVARRPLVLEPTRKAYVGTYLFCSDWQNQLDLLFKKLGDCTDSRPDEFEMVGKLPIFSGFNGPSKPSIYISEGYAGDSSDSDFSSDDTVDAHHLVFDMHGDSKSNCVSAPWGAETTEEDDIDLELEFDQKQWIDRLSALVLEYVAANHKMPPTEIINSVISGKLQISKDGLISPIVVNSDLRIILPAYNELELRMTPLARTVYILFLCHPEGIVLKNIGDYKDELQNIYLLVKPGADSDLADSYIRELTYPGSDSLQQKLSLIKRSIGRYIIPEKLSKQYIISGARGKEYRIAIPKEKISLPRVLLK